MQQVCVVVPILPNRTNAARDFMRELATKRKAEFDRSERRIGITKEVWFLAEAPSGDQLVAYIESEDQSEDCGRASKLFAQSRDEFDLWFKRQLTEATGLDLNNPPPDRKLPELLSSYQV